MSVILNSSGLKFPGNTTQTSSGLSYGQTWTDVTSSRSPDTTYTNTTGRTIAVAVRLNFRYNVWIRVFLDGLQIYDQLMGIGFAIAANDEMNSALFFVPNGSSYSVTLPSGINTIATWYELR